MKSLHKAVFHFTAEAHRLRYSAFNFRKKRLWFGR